ncbi:Type III pantothenate kinase [Novipirellula aureliae]|uniref:Type III pantothenate kinase n=1 Tax=Novipirellula aureliae TaxID=2527966 RepID=A0A5C6E537_9BACT|nr:type III pantothenate kinase [Novipirellula aureliae]TWU44052.1 Type III pantothenate kinase [Novipirellula aureliae]
MNERSGLVCIDIGNSAAKVLIRTDSNQIAAEVQPNAKPWPRNAFPISKQNWAESVLDWVSSVCAEVSSKPPTGPSTGPRDEWQWRIASVQRQAAQQLKAVIERSFRKRSIRLISCRDVPMVLNVDYPERVGIDRLLSAYAALQRHPKPVIVVDAGSAVTVDYIDEKDCYCGGAIFPGLQLQTNALTLGTDALPPVDWSVVHSGRIPAKETSEAIALGVFTGVTAAIDRLIDRYQQTNRSGRRIKIVLCGGDADSISKWIEHEHFVVPDLVLEGIADLTV